MRRAATDVATLTSSSARVTIRAWSAIRGAPLLTSPPPVRSRTALYVARRYGAPSSGAFCSGVSIEGPLVPAWSLLPGTVIKRTTLHATYGGSQRGGISPSRTSPNVMIFTSPAGHQYGYVFDGFQDDGLFHYTGEGQVGDQLMEHGNRALAQHVADGRVVRLFLGTSGDVSYRGEMRVDDTRPYYTADAPDREQAIRKVIVFRLHPVGELKRDGLPAAKAQWKPEHSATEWAIVSAENQETETFTTGAVAAREAERREASLIRDFQRFRESQTLTPLKRLRIKPPGETQPLYTDLYDPSEKRILEAKGTVTREAIRMALGQLLDYRRFLADAQLAVLLPERPREDLVSLLQAHNILIIARDGDGFSSV